MTPIVGAVYRHFKGKLYRVISVGKDANWVNREVVVYVSIDTNEVWVRTLEDFTAVLAVDYFTGEVQSDHVCGPHHCTDRDTRPRFELARDHS